jgi:hypothetical protein
MTEPKYRVGQVVMWHRSKHGSKRDMPFAVLEVTTEGIDEPFYRIDRKNFLAEHMLRPLNDEEKS